MALLLNLSSPSPTSFQSTRHLPTTRSRQNEAAQEWSSLLHSLNSHGRFSCLFTGGRKEDQARKALEGALGGKKDEYEKWDKEIKKREELGGGSDGGGGGWIGGWGRRFGWSNGDDFWQEAQQASLSILGIFLMYLIVVKGELMLAVVFNPLLYALRGTRNGFGFITDKILRRTAPDGHADSDSISKKEAYSHVSAKESVVSKWGRE